MQYHSSQKKVGSFKPYHRYPNMIFFTFLQWNWSLQRLLATLAIDGATFTFLLDIYDTIYYAIFFCCILPNLMKATLRSRLSMCTFCGPKSNVVNRRMYVKVNYINKLENWSETSRASELQIDRRGGCKSVARSDMLASLPLPSWAQSSQVETVAEPGMGGKDGWRWQDVRRAPQFLSTGGQRVGGRRGGAWLTPRNGCAVSRGHRSEDRSAFSRSADCLESVWK